ncbi:MAG: 50S ribosome-binding GTPase [Erysipelotrichia bacterium]|nr:50S ribosome-binding GTPase [Erysipelotrichia bacterium]
MEKKCIGCGATLQSNDPQIIGYVINTDMDYCQRCFKMIHYDQHKENDFKPDNELIIEKLEKLNGTHVWIIDIFDLDSSLNSVLKDFYQKHSCNIVINKCDLLPKTINYEKIAKYVLKRLHDLNIQTEMIITRGVNNDFRDNFNQYIFKNENLIITGLANVGKSTVINELFGKNILTTNRYPATTVEMNEIKINDNSITDTVGIICAYSIQFYLDSKQLKTVIPQNRIKPTVYQINSNQSLFIGGLLRLDILTQRKCTIVLYFSDLLAVHRTKQQNAHNLWSKHYGKDLLPIIKKCSLSEMKKIHFVHNGKKDYFISGLGFITVVADKAALDFYIYEPIMIKEREAMI